MLQQFHCGWCDRTLVGERVPLTPYSPLYRTSDNRVHAGRPAQEIVEEAPAPPPRPPLKPLKLDELFEPMVKPGRRS
jgi:hypothetical protein